MTKQNIREEWRNFARWELSTNEADKVADFWIDKLNTTLKEIVEGIGDDITEKTINSYDETNSRDEAVEKGILLGINQALDDIKQLIQSKIIK